MRTVTLLLSLCPFALKFSTLYAADTEGLIRVDAAKAADPSLRACIELCALTA